ncbi:MAG: hypothetical protein IPM02_01645 [Betaproteobacteria bacterium]|nr:hypothetical protein [Betaproteobacteria bacterium]
MKDGAASAVAQTSTGQMVIHSCRLSGRPRSARRDAMTACSAALSHQTVHARPGATVKRRRIRWAVAGLTGLVGAAVVALASSALAQPADDPARSEPGRPGSIRPLATIQGPDVNARTKSTTAVLQYYSVPGTAFQPITSGTTYAYINNGCIHQTGGTDARFHAPVYLPEGTTVKYVRLYYYDASIEDMSLYFVAYVPGTGNTTLASMLSTGTAGLGSTVSAELDVVFNPESFNYVLVWAPTFALSAQQICGVRIAYYPPVQAATLCSLDADGNGAIDALTDGLLILRAMFGLTGTAVTSNAIGGGVPSRTTWVQLRDFFNGSCGTSFAQ